MEPLSLNEIHDLLLDMLKELDSFCAFHNIKYCLGWGSELGAVLYKGFIPWDDDIDVCMPRNDYNRFIKLFNGSDKYELLIPKKSKKYYYPFVKMCDKRIYSHSTILRDSFGVFIDIIPFDTIKNKSSIDQKTTKKLLFLGFAAVRKKPLLKMHSAKYYRNNNKKCIILRHLKTLLLYWFSILHWRLSYRLSIIKIGLTIKRNYGTDCFCHIVWSPDAIRRSIDYFDTRIKVKFEGIDTYINCDYDKELRAIYGDYTIVPDENNRKSHSFYSFFWKL